MTKTSNDGEAGITALILAGGEGRRYGADKAVAERPDGVQFLAAVVDATAASATDIVVLGNEREGFVAEKSFNWWSEPVPGDGPLSAVSQWVQSQPELTSQTYVLIACDYAFADAASVARITSFGRGKGRKYDVVLPHGDGYDHPLFASYSRDGLTRLAAAAEKEASLMKALESLSIVRLVVPSSASGPLRNVNRPEDLSFAE